jgi:transposase
MKALPVEFRHRVIALTQKGFSSSQIAELLGVTASWVRSIKRRHASGQSLQLKPRGNRRSSLAQRQGERIRKQIADHPSTTLADLKRDLQLDTSISNLWYALQALKIHLKKKPFTRPNKVGPTWPPTASSGTCLRPASTPVASSSSTKPSARRP